MTVGVYSSMTVECRLLKCLTYRKSCIEESSMGWSIVWKSLSLLKVAKMRQDLGW